MKENIVYTTPEGNTHKVLMFDEINKMAYIHIIGGHHRWVHESEYSTWTVNDTAEMPKIYIPDIPAQMIEQEPVISVTLDEVVADYLDNSDVKTKKKTVKKEKA